MTTIRILSILKLVDSISIIVPVGNTIAEEINFICDGWGFDIEDGVLLAGEFVEKGQYDEGNDYRRGCSKRIESERKSTSMSFPVIYDGEV